MPKPDPRWQWTTIDLGATHPPVRLRSAGNVDALLDDPDTETRFNADGYMPYFATLWPGAVALARLLLARQDDLQPANTILELGCGLGLVSIVARRLGLDPLATDYADEALTLTQENARANDIATIRTARLDWREPNSSRNWNLILAADVLYETRFHPEIADFLADELAPAGVAWVTDPCRGVADAFPAIATGRGLDVRETPLGSVPGPGGGYVPCRLFEITRQR